MPPFNYLPSKNLHSVDDIAKGEKLCNTYPAFRTAPVQLKEAAAVPVCFALYGEFITLSPSSSSETAVVRDMRSSSEICNKELALVNKQHKRVENVHNKQVILITKT